VRRPTRVDNTADNANITQPQAANRISERFEPNTALWAFHTIQPYSCGLSKPNLQPYKQARRPRVACRMIVTVCLTEDWQEHTVGLMLWPIAFHLLTQHLMATGHGSSTCLHYSCHGLVLDLNKSLTGAVSYVEKLSTRKLVACDAFLLPFCVLRHESDINRNKYTTLQLELVVEFSSRIYSAYSGCLRIRLVNWELHLFLKSLDVAEALASFSRLQQLRRRDEILKWCPCLHRFSTTCSYKTKRCALFVVCFRCRLMIFTSPPPRYGYVKYCD